MLPHRCISPLTEKWCPKAQTHTRIQGEKHCMATLFKYIFICPPALHNPALWRQFSSMPQQSLFVRNVRYMQDTFCLEGKVCVCLCMRCSSVYKAISPSVCVRRRARLCIQLKLCLWTSPLKVQFVHNLAVNDLSFARRVCFSQWQRAACLCEWGSRSACLSRDIAHLVRLVDRALLDSKVM